MNITPAPDAGPKSIEDKLRNLEMTLESLQQFSRKLSGVGDLETGCRIALGEISRAIGADQAYLQTRSALGENLVVVENMIEEEIDTRLRTDGESESVQDRGDGASLLVSPIHKTQPCHAVFIRRFDRPPFSAADRQFITLFRETILSPMLETLRLHDSLRGLYLSTVQALASAIDAKDRFTLGHSHRVATCAKAIGRRLDLSEQELKDLEIAAIMHDLGKIGTPETILSKPGKLSSEEFAVIKRHPEVAGQILASVYPEHIIHGATQHHERLDGSGYPLGLAGDEISAFGRIIAVADVYDALTSDRPYRPAMPLETALQTLHAGCGHGFDRSVYNALIVALLENNVIFAPP